MMDSMIAVASRLAGRVAPSGLPLARHAVRSGLARVLGPPPFDPDRDLGDPGLFGPESASWEVIADPSAIVGGLRALIVQLLHPHAMAGVADHSAFRADPLGRLHRTSGYVTTTTFGSVAEAVTVARTVRRVHRRVRGVAPDGARYDAADPHLLAWVSIALTSSFLATHRAYAPRPVDAAAEDAFVAEQSRGAALLDPRVDVDALVDDPGALADFRAGVLPLPMIDDGRLPTGVAGLQARLAAYTDELAVYDEGREAFRFLLWPDLPASVKAAYLPMAGGALATLTPDQRQLLGLPTSRLVAWPVLAQTRALLTALRVTTGASPTRAAAARRARATPAATASPPQ